MSAGTALEQLRLSLDCGVLYLHRGWSSMVDSLTDAARAAVPGLYVAGDWVGGTGLLSDASLASARTVATLVARDLLPRTAVPAPQTGALEHH